HRRQRYRAAACAAGAGPAAAGSAAASGHSRQQCTDVLERSRPIQPLLVLLPTSPDLARPADSDEARLRDFIIIATRPGFGTHFRLRTTSRPGCCSGVFATVFPDEDKAWATAAGGVRCNVAVGSKADKPLRAKIQICP